MGGGALLADLMHKSKMSSVKIKIKMLLHAACCSVYRNHKGFKL